MTTTAHDAGPAPQEGKFKRALGLWDAVAVVVGSMIGSGIFIVSAETSRLLGSPAFLLLAWVVAGLLTVVAALCYSELASMYPRAGGQYVFLRQAFGPMAAFLYGWTVFAVIQSGTIAAVGVGFAKFLGVFVPWVSNQNVLFSLDVPLLAGQVWHWKLSTLQVIAVGLIGLLTFVNCRGIEAAKLIQTTFTAAKVFALSAIVVLGLLAFDRFAGASANFSDMHSFWTPHDLKGNELTGLSLLLVMGAAMVGSLFSCDAWNNITFAGEEVKDAEKILPKSLAIGTLLVVGLYLAANIVYLLLLPVHGDAAASEVAARGIQYAKEDRVGTAAAQVIFGPAGESIMAGAIMISTFGCLNGLILAGARVYYAMAADGLFFKRAAHLDPSTNVPVFGLVLQGIWSALLATSGTYSDLLDYVVFAALLFYVLTVLAVFILRKREPETPRPFRVPLYPFLPVLYIVSAAAIMAGIFCTKPQFAGFGLLIILSGLPVYFMFARGQKSEKP